MNWDAILEGFKEFFRTGLYAALVVVVPQLISMLENGQAIDWRVLGIAAIVALLRAVDKALHESGQPLPTDFDF